MTLWIASVDGDCLNVLDFEYDTIRQILDDGGVLYWECQGAIRKVPRPVLADAFASWTDWRTLKERHPETAFPPQMGVIEWNQTVTPRDPSRAEQAPRLHPLPRPQPPESSTRSD